MSEHDRLEAQYEAAKARKRDSEQAGLVEALEKAIARMETIRVRLCRISAADGTAKAELVDYIRQCEAEADAALKLARGEQS